MKKKYLLYIVLLFLALGAFYLLFKSKTTVIENTYEDTSDPKYYDESLMNPNAKM